MGSKLTKLANRLDAIENHLGLVNEEIKKELEVDKWYKDPNSQYLVHITKFLGNHNYVEVYGFGINGNWFNKWDTVVHQLCGEATPQEVEQALIEEAKRRGYKDGVICEFGIAGHRRPIRTSEYTYEPWQETMAICMGTDVIFDEKSGQWATIIDQDKFAELKEAFKNGAVIEIKCNDGRWCDIGVPAWNPNHEYRIKPVDKPKVGDVVRAWNDDEGQYFIGIVHEIASHGEFQVKFRKGNNFSGYYFFAKNAKTLNEQEAIELLFGKESLK